MKGSTWKILDRGIVPLSARTIPYQCQCGHEAELPVLGRVEAITGSEEGGDSGIIFDPVEKYALPTTIQCRRCGRIMTNAPEETTDVR